MSLTKRWHLLLSASVLLLGATTAAHAVVTISSAQTQNMTCASGVCTPTAADAVLNVNDLTTMLASGNATVNTGSGPLAQQVEDIVVTASFDWASSNSLTLDAYRSVSVQQPVAANGAGGVALVTNDGGSGGTLAFIAGGSLSFLGTANGLSVNGTSYTLENSVANLAATIAANPAGNYALANNYDAAPDGTYPGAPIASTLSGTVEGLGNTISNLSVVCSARSCLSTGLFAYNAGAIRNIRLVSSAITAKTSLVTAGGLAERSSGVLFNAFFSGSVKGGVTDVGGLVGENSGTIANSGADARVEAEGGHNQDNDGSVGGLAGQNSGTISESYAMGSVSQGKMLGRDLGGLVGESGGTIGNSYATAPVKGADGGPRNGVSIGGLVGDSEATITDSYSTGHVDAACAEDVYVGGFIGVNEVNNTESDTYWDKKTSGDNKGVCTGTVTGITGVTTSQLKSGLPAGFDPTIWAEDPSINNGLPYLIANPPPQ